MFQRQNRVTFIFIETMSHDLLVQVAYWTNKWIRQATNQYTKELSKPWNIAERTRFRSSITYQLACVAWRVFSNLRALGERENHDKKSQSREEPGEPCVFAIKLLKPLNYAEFSICFHVVYSGTRYPTLVLGYSKVTASKTLLSLFFNTFANESQG